MISRRKAVLIFSIVAASFGEVLKVESNTFTFPEVSAVSAKKALPGSSWFKYNGINPLSRSITFSWNFSECLNNKAGAITIYSLLGMVVARIPVNKKTGTATWKFDAGQCKNGLFIAQICFGGHTKNLKLMLWK